MNGKYMKNKFKIDFKSDDLFIKIIVILLNVNYLLFPIFYVTVITLLFLESITYPGFVDNHFIVSIELLFIMVLITGFVGLVTHLSDKNFKNSISSMMYQFVYSASALSTIPIVILLSISGSMLSDNRDSILIGKGILFYPHRVIDILILVIYFLLIYTILIKMKIFDKINSQKIFDAKNILNTQIVTNAFYYIIAGLIILSSLFSAFPSFKQNLGYLVKKPLYTYDQKMRLQIGPVYDYYMFVKNNTPKGAYILKPEQQGRWPDISNEGFTRYFLYPRNFVSEENLKNEKEKVDYIFLIGGLKLHRDEELDRWPNFNVPAIRIILYSKSGLSVYKVLNQDYDYKNFDYKEYWGVIEVDKTKKW